MKDKTDYHKKKLITMSIHLYYNRIIIINIQMRCAHVTCLFLYLHLVMVITVNIFCTLAMCYVLF